MSRHIAERFAAQYDFALEWLHGILSAYSDDDMKFSLAPGKNHALWILGHLIASEDDFPLYLGRGDLMFPELSEIFSQGKPLRAFEECPPPHELREALGKVVERNKAVYAGLEDSELDEPHALAREGEPDYFGTKVRVIMAWQLHMIYHTGQLGAILSMAGKKVYG